MRTKKKAVEYLYVIKPIPDKVNWYEIEKVYGGFEFDTYKVQISPDNPDSVYCNCPGFLMQKYPKPQHKHVRIAVDYYERVIVGLEHVCGDIPFGGIYKLEPKTNNPIFVEYLGVAP